MRQVEFSRAKALLLLRARSRAHTVQTSSNSVIPVRYFFNIYNGGYTADAEGLELNTIGAVREEARTALPSIAADEIPRDGDLRHFAVVVTDETGRPVYTASLNYIGLWLTDPPPKN